MARRPTRTEPMVKSGVSLEPRRRGDGPRQAQLGVWLHGSPPRAARRPYRPAPASTTRSCPDRPEAISSRPFLDPAGSDQAQPRGAGHRRRTRLELPVTDKRLGRNQHGEGCSGLSSSRPNRPDRRPGSSEIDHWSTGSAWRRRRLADSASVPSMSWSIRRDGPGTRAPIPAIPGALRAPAPRSEALRGLQDQEGLPGHGGVSTLASLAVITPSKGARNGVVRDGGRLGPPRLGRLHARRPRRTARRKSPPCRSGWRRGRARALPARHGAGLLEAEREPRWPRASPGTSPARTSYPCRRGPRRRCR